MISEICYSKNRNVCSIINAYDESITIEESFYNVVNGWCNSFGSSIEGSQESIKKCLRIKQLIPIYLRLEDSFIIFPLNTDINGDMTWVNYGAIKQIKKVDEHSSIIVFFNDEIKNVKMNIRSLRKQMFRCKCFLSFLKVQRESLVIN